jgi:catechol 2,3-dioxygenase-like lactoylglutathione lyase family enzyme
MRALRLVSLALLALILPGAHAQSAPPLAGIAHVALRVKDLAASIAFYQSLGFEQAFDLRRDGVPYESFIKIDDQQFIELYPVTAKDPDPAFLHLCFEGEDLPAIHDDYVSHGLTPIGVRKAGAGNLLFTMPGPLQPIGPGGKAIPQNIEYTQYMEGSLHSKDAGQHLGKDRIADRLLGVSLAMVDVETARMFYINQLSMKPLPGEPMTLHLPGNSGEEVQIYSASLGRHARFTLETSNLGKASRHLSHAHIKFEKAADVLAFTDPDGNQIVIRQR